MLQRCFSDAERHFTATSQLARVEFQSCIKGNLTGELRNVNHIMGVFQIHFCCHGYTSRNCLPPLNELTHNNSHYTVECTQGTIKKRDILFLTITLANLNRFL